MDKCTDHFDRFMHLSPHNSRIESCFSQSGPVSIDGAINVPIFPEIGKNISVRLPPSKANQLITMSQVSSDNDDEVPVVSDKLQILHFL